MHLPRDGAWMVRMEQDQAAEIQINYAGQELGLGQQNNLMNSAHVSKAHAQGDHVALTCLCVGVKQLAKACIDCVGSLDWRLDDHDVSRHSNDQHSQCMCIAPDMTK